MTDTLHNTPSPDASENESDLRAEILIGRIIDGESSPDDRGRFELLAAAEPSLWRTLALRQQDMTLLAQRIEQQTESAVRMELPVASTVRSLLFPSRLNMLLTFSGWAAMILIGVGWWAWAFNASSTVNPIDRVKQAGPSSFQPMADPDDLTYDDHLQRYLRAPWVLGELEPALIEVITMSDGTQHARVVRRIEEIIPIEPEATTPVDDQPARDSDDRVPTPPGESSAPPTAPN